MEKIVFAVMDNKSVWVNGSRCLISYVNVIVLLIKILNTIQNEFLWPLFHSVFLCTLQSQSSIYLADLPTHMGPSCSVYPSSSWVPLNTAKCLGMQLSVTKSIIVICAIAYINIVFVQDIWTSLCVTTTVCNAVVINKTHQCYYQYYKGIML
jgi:hypothetical protein